MRLFNDISNKFIFFVLVCIVFFKILLLLLIKNKLISISFGGGSDAGYYHNYAIGQAEFAVNTWPAILYYLNSIGFYSRDIISYILFFMNLILIPLLVTKILNLKFHFNQKFYLYVFFILSIYPTLFFYSLDVYRDVFMVVTFLVGCLVVKNSFKTSNLFLYFLAISIGFLLIGLRPYLGYAFLLSLLIWKIRFTKKRLILFSLLYFLALFIANFLGLFKALTEYRSGFEEAGGGSTLGLDFSNPIMFLPNFILSMLGQLFGLYITNITAILLLFIETIPIFIMLLYIIKNIRLADGFARFLIIFFVLYASVWLIGNDNLGTAVRLRIYNYLAIYICFFYILKIKSSILFSKGSKQ